MKKLLLVLLLSFGWAHACTWDIEFGVEKSPSTTLYAYEGFSPYTTLRCSQLLRPFSVPGAFYTWLVPEANLSTSWDRSYARVQLIEEPVGFGFATGIDTRVWGTGDYSFKFFTRIRF